ncbi:monooxygenase [Paenibacillus antibioticophila]|uniref:Monooxygenase n=1 Tax=Paenibacillus antibioticophila TaxID=1274374 RepID=A0A920CH79_9BACL|nr:LLM class flavin-dependent oxidoreductase [Paenibacillus antibioticophila]GIO40136.1 monooxygenase [Paenibacillus antibioticophila]
MSKGNARQLILGAMMFFPAGEHISSWRHPVSEAERLLDFDYYRNIVETAERGKFDMFFYADELYVWDRFESSVAQANSIRPEPFTLLSALSVVTKDIALAATVSTTYNEPYHIARKLATLDYISKGRAAWNIVTSQTDEEARNFGKDRHLQHELRYERAKEFVDVTRGLWDSWEENALLFNKQTGQFADRSKLHSLDYKGQFFNVHGPLNITRPPQGHPVLVQAGASEAGKEVAAATAELVFAPGGSLEEAQRLYRDLKGRLGKYGRSEHELKVLPYLIPVIGRTADEVAERVAIVEDLTPESLGLDLLSHYLGRDVSGYPLDQPLPFIPEIDGFNQSHTNLLKIREWIQEENLTLHQLYKRAANQRVFGGTPEQIADYIEEWFTKKAADGFNVAFPHLPGALHDFVELVVPELQRRGLFKTEYTPGNFRDKLGLAKPANRFAAARDKESIRI